MRIPNLEAMIEAVVHIGGQYCPKCGIEWMYHINWKVIKTEYGTEYSEPECPDVWRTIARAPSWLEQQDIRFSESLRYAKP